MSKKLMIHVIFVQQKNFPSPSAVLQNTVIGRDNLPEIGIVGS